ncbi:MAG: hypothetical protein EYC70_14440 [Planctomycetota bacterium]|nr:MAG: hypothetical protein EYC70_14440 [Planctomycetota bacterium]
MKLRLLFLAAAALAPACQNPRLQQTVRDQDEQLAALNSERQRLLSERDRVAGENERLEDDLRLQQERNRDLQQRVAAMEAQPSDSELEGLRNRLEGTGVGVSRLGETIVLALPQEITFPSGSADLTKQGQASLDAVSAVLQTDYAGKTLWVEGHTDNDPIRVSKWESNLHLSAARALAVADYLIQGKSVDPATLRVAGHGEFDPVTPNDTPEGKARNRRVEILIFN